MIGLWREIAIFNMVDIELFYVIELDEIVLNLGYKDESLPLFNDYLRPTSNLDEGLYALACDKDIHCLAMLVRSFLLVEFSAINLGFILVQPTVNKVIDDVIKHISFDDMELDGEPCFGDVASSNLDNSSLSHDESFGFDDLDLELNLTHDLNVPQTEMQEEVPLSEVPNDHVVNKSDTHVDVEPVVHVGRIEEHFVEQVKVVHVSGQKYVEQGDDIK
ncbi:hypothetical protein Tco_0079518 [Tanacetum coccineum]